MFSDNVHVFLMIAAFVSLLALRAAVERANRRESDPVRRAFNSLRLGVIAVAALTVMLWLRLPHGGLYIANISEEIKSLEEVRQYLKQHDEALTETINALSTFLVIIFMVFASVLYDFCKAVATSRGAQENNRL